MKESLPDTFRQSGLNVTGAAYMKRGLSVVLLFCAVGCDKSPTNPSSPYPNVAGNYAGLVTFSFPSSGILACAATTTVTQSGWSVTVAPMSLAGDCSRLVPSLPVGNLTLSTTGSLFIGTQSNLYVASCNGYYNASVVNGSFAGSGFEFSILYTAQSGGCVSQVGNFTISATPHGLEHQRVTS